MTHPDDVSDASAWIAASLLNGGTLYAFGNGGSAAQASHLVGELIGRYRSNRRPLRAVALSDVAVLSCIANDFGYAQMFARQLEALARPGDVAVGMSTSGRSANVLEALRVADERGACAILVTSEEAPEPPAGVLAVRLAGHGAGPVQEATLAWLHAVCEPLEGVA